MKRMPYSLGKSTPVTHILKSVPALSVSILLIGSGSTISRITLFIGAKVFAKHEPWQGARL